MKIYTLLLISLSLLSLEGLAQQSFTLKAGLSERIPIEKKSSRQDLQKSQRTAFAVCPNDTVFYTNEKASNLGFLQLVGSGQGMYGEGLGQWFDAPQPVTIHGFVFYARNKYDASTTVNVSIYSAKADSTPNTILATTTTTLSSTASTLVALQRNVNFSTPVTVTGPYLVVVEAPVTSSDTLEFVTTAQGDGRGERLSKVRALGNQWFDVGRVYNLDADFYTFPIVNYSIFSRFSVTGNLVTNSPVNFINTSSPVFFSRFYNFAAFVNQTRVSFSWNVGDGTPDSFAVNLSHTYANPGTYNVKLSDTLYAYSMDCMADTTAVVNISTNLPVKLVSWEAKRKFKEVLLTWGTATEQNNRGFEIQRSADGENFSTIAFVKSKPTNGNSTATISYDFIDNTPLNGNIYYRLKQLDIDNRIALSSVVLLKGIIGSKLAMSNLYPNPANKTLNVVLTASVTQKITVIVTNLAGKTVLQQPASIIAGNNNLQLNVGKLAAGSYTIKTVCSDGCETAVRKFVKQ